MSERNRENLGTRRIPKLRPPEFPDADQVALDAQLTEPRPDECVDVLLVNPPSPDGGIWIRTQHRVGRRSRENMVWPQVSLAQMAALLHPAYTVGIIDAVAERMTWDEYEEELRKKKPRYYITQVTAPTLQNDMYGTFLAKSMGAVTMAFGTHVTPMPRQMLRRYPSLDFVLRGEPELTLIELVETLEAYRQMVQPDDHGCGEPGRAGEALGENVPGCRSRLEACVDHLAGYSRRRTVGTGRAV